MKLYWRPFFGWPELYIVVKRSRSWFKRWNELQGEDPERVRIFFVDHAYEDILNRTSVSC